MKISKKILAIGISTALLSGCGSSGSSKLSEDGGGDGGADTSAPTLSNAKPSGSLVSGTSSAILSLTTNENASCKYSNTANQNFDAMTATFSTTGGKNHTNNISGLSNGESYQYYIRCKDSANNKNSNDYVISFNVGQTVTVGDGFTVGHLNTFLTDIPDSWITQAKSNLHIAYNHTSHGSQLITGMNALKQFPAFGNKYAWSNTSHGDNQSLSLDDRGIHGTPDLSQGDGDSDNDGIANWAEDTYTLLDNPSNNHINVIMWSWCNISGHNIDRYLSSMEWLIGQFSEGGSHARAANHPVKFVFMTAHANGGGENDSADTPNKQIRSHVISHNRILFDFSDIENYNPNGDYFLDKRLDDSMNYDSTGDNKRNANWAAEYLSNNNGDELDQLTHGEGIAGYSGAGSCAHSNDHNNDSRLNCVLKGRGVWHLFARLAGWNGQ